MAWQDETVPTLRVMLGDLSETAPTYTDDSLEKTIVVAAKQVSALLRFDPAFVANVANVTISPDPTAAATKNDAFVNLVTLKAAAILDRAAAGLAASRGIIVKDGGAAIDLSKVAEAKLRLLEKGWNAVYDDAVFEYRYYRSQAVAGAAVLTPFRLFANGGLGGGSDLNDDPRSRNFFY